MSRSPSGKNVAELADQVLPALTTAATLLEQQDPAEADNFRRTVLVAIDAAQPTRARPAPLRLRWPARSPPPSAPREGTGSAPIVIGPPWRAMGSGRSAG
ncbi:hypothetical protein [Nocardia amikacinitolerans]|uniref:hypothetical protein n=1 Tax=Nocardia amikacinitolerans TaxID=756689 RepID=UPI0020A23CA3|nr:hypothetical protein [Nocardia amikacinitolerans]